MIEECWECCCCGNTFPYESMAIDCCPPQPYLCCTVCDGFFLTEDEASDHECESV